MNRYRDMPIERCPCGEIDGNRVHHESALGAYHPFPRAAILAAIASLRNRSET